MRPTFRCGAPAATAPPADADDADTTASTAIAATFHQATRSLLLLPLLCAHMVLRLPPAIHLLHGFASVYV